MIPGAREKIILDTLRKEGVAPVHRLAEIADASESTIRRDLERMEERGLISRTHGGAVFAGERDDVLADVARVASAEKERMGAAAAALVPAGATVVIDVGTSALAAAKVLAASEKMLTVISASWPVLELFAARTDVNVIALGGTYSREYRCCGGTLAAAAMSQMSADWAIMGASGLTEGGVVRDTTAAQVPVKQAIIAHSARVALLLDSGKIPGVGVYNVCDVGAVQALVTDGLSHEELAQYCSSHGVEVVEA